MQERNVVVLANLKPRNMRGVKSFGMLIAASDAAHENVELLVPPEGAVPGDRVWFGSIDEKDSLPDAASPNQATPFLSFCFSASFESLNCVQLRWKPGVMRYKM